MHRRRFLEGSAVGMGLVAGCSGQSASPTAESTATESETGTTPNSPTESPTTGEPSREESPAYFVGPDGSDGNEGTREAPLASIQEGLHRAGPGETVYLLPGRYHEHVETVRSGNAGEPITIAGPAEAEFHGADPDESHTLRITHSHVHLRGFTLTSLHDPERPNELSSFIENEPVRIHPPLDSDEYLTDVVVKPSRLGYSRQQLIGLDRTKHAEIGEFRVIGLAGARYFLTGREGHNAEIVYVGTAPDNRGTSFYPWDDYDRTSHVHVHHIDNSAGHPHSEIVNAKLGTHDVLVEYCTDAGGSKNTEDSPAASVRLQSYGATVRWNDLRDGHGYGIEIGEGIARKAQRERPESELTEAERLGGTNNEVYGNRIVGFAEGAFSFPLSGGGQSPDAQTAFCGNEYDGRSQGDPDTACPSSVPTGDGVGHLGGDSPWA